MSPVAFLTALLFPEVAPADLLPLEAPDITIGLGDIVAAYVGNHTESSFGTVVAIDRNNPVDGRDWFRVDFGEFGLWLTNEDEYCDLRLVLKAEAI